MSKTQDSGTGPSGIAIEDFPPEPSFRARWAPIRIEPIAQSGECVTIGLAVIPDSGKPAVTSDLQPDALRCIFGERSKQLLSVANLVLNDLRDHLHASPTLEDWISPVVGARVDPERLAAGDDLADVVRQGLRQTA